MASPSHKARTASLHDDAYARLVQMLVDRRIKSGMSQQAVAAELGWNQSIIAKIESVQRRLDVIELIRIAKLWLKKAVRNDVRAIAADYERRFNLKPRSIRIADLARGWGSCGAKGAISINSHLVFAPRRVLEYVVAHELAHLRYRQHRPRFWTYLQTIFPTQHSAKNWLEKHGGGLGDDFLTRHAEAGFDDRTSCTTLELRQ